MQEPRSQREKLMLLHLLPDGPSAAVGIVFLHPPSGSSEAPISPELRRRMKSHFDWFPFSSLQPSSFQLRVRVLEPDGRGQEMLRCAVEVAQYIKKEEHLDFLIFTR